MWSAAWTGTHAGKHKKATALEEALLELSPLAPLDCSKGDLGALLNSIILTTGSILGPWECIHDMKDAMQVVSAAACTVLVVGLRNVMLVSIKHDVRQRTVLERVQSLTSISI